MSHQATSEWKILKQMQAGLMLQRGVLSQCLLSNRPLQATTVSCYSPGTSLIPAISMYFLDSCPVHYLAQEETETCGELELSTLWLLLMLAPCSSWDFWGLKLVIQVGGARAPGKAVGLLGMEVTAPSHSLACLFSCILPQEFTFPSQQVGKQLFCLCCPQKLRLSSAKMPEN